MRVLLVAAVGLDLQIPEKKKSQQNPFWSIEKGSPKNSEQAGPTYSALAITRQTLVPLALALLLLFQLLLLQLLGFFGAGLIVCARGKRVMLAILDQVRLKLEDPSSFSCKTRTESALFAGGARRARAESPRGAEGVGDGCAEGGGGEAEDGRHCCCFRWLVG